MHSFFWCGLRWHDLIVLDGLVKRSLDGEFECVNVQMDSV